MENYIATLSLAPVTDGDVTFASWRAEFDCAPERDGELVRTIGQGVFQTALAALKARFKTFQRRTSGLSIMKSFNDFLS